MILIWRVSLYPSGNEKIQEIAHAIKSGAKEYLKLQYQVIAIVAGVIAILIGIISAFARFGGGIYTKGADLVGKVEAECPFSRYVSEVCLTKKPHFIPK